VVVAADDPLIGMGTAGNAGDDVVERLEVPIGFHFEMHLRGSGADVVRDGQRAAPCGGDGAAGEHFEQRLRIAVGNREDGNPGEGDGFGDRQAFGVLGGADAGSERVAGIDRHIHHAAPLHAVLGAHGSDGEDVARGITVFVRVGVNQAADSSMLGGDLGLDAAPGFAVASDDDGALHGDAEAIELLVVGGDAEVHIDQGRGDVAVGGIGVVRGELLAVLRGCGVLRDGRLIEFGGEAMRLDEFDGAFLGGREEHVEVLDGRVHAELFEFGEEPLGVVLIVGRSDMVRPGGQSLHVGAQVGGIGEGAEFGFPVALGAGGLGGVSAQRRGVGGKTQRGA
jgi:hypothetical protein